MSVMRMAGLASGMEIDSMVKELMMVERLPLDKLEREKQILQWQQEDYRSLNSQLFNFRNEVFDMKLESAFNIKKGTSSADNVISVTAGANTANGSYSITVNRLAEGVAKGSVTQLAAARDAEGKSLSLYEQFAQFQERGFTEEDTIAVTINGTQLEFDIGQDTIATVVSQINKADLGLTASYDNNYNRFFLNTSTTGQDAQITIENDTANFFAYGTEDSILGLQLEAGTVYKGQNASINFGEATNIESASNNMLINGISLSLQGTGSSTIVVSSDVDGIVESITGLIDSYNKIMETLYDKIGEKRSYDHQPLTAAEKKDMSEKEIELWGDKARSGLLRSDTYLNNLVNDIRGAMSRIIDTGGSYNTLSGIGISTQLWGEKGQLYIDATALREAINTDPQGVQKLFTQKGATDKSQKGITNNLYDLVNSGITYLSDKAGQETSFSAVDGSYIGKKLDNLEKEIDKWETKLIRAEDRYWRQYTYMETMINQMNTQSLWLQQQFQ